MTTPTTTTAAQPSNLDEALTRIDTLLSTASAPLPVQMTSAQLSEYALAETTKAAEEVVAGKVETAKERLAALKAQVVAAKAVYDSGATLAPIVMFKDPWQTSPNSPATKNVVDVPQSAISPTTDDSNVQFTRDVVVVTEKGRTLSPAVKALFSIAKAAADAPIRKALVTKAGAEVAPAIIAKAGEAMQVLEKLAAVFGYTPEPGEGLLDCDFRWTVSDTISALQSAARTEGIISQMTGLLGAPAAKAALLALPAAPAAAAAPAPATETAPAPVTETASAAWPTDMAKVELDAKTGLLKSKSGEKDEEPYWGLDSGKAPAV